MESWTSTPEFVRRSSLRRCSVSSTPNAVDQPTTIFMFSIHPIGYVRSTLRDAALAPKQADEGATGAWLEFLPGMATGLQHLREGDHVLVLTWLHHANRATLEVHPRDDNALPLRGVFSTRSADRPNPVGIHRVTIVEIVGGTRLRVNALEAIDQTPIIDVKPVLEHVSER